MDGAFKTSVLLYVALFPSIAYGQREIELHQRCSFVGMNRVTAPVVLVLQPHVQMEIERIGFIVFSFRDSPGAKDAARAGFHGVLARTFEDEGQNLLLDPWVEREWEETPPNANAVDALNDHFNSMGSLNCRDLAKISFKGDLERLKDHDRFDSVVVSRIRGTKLESTRIVKSLSRLDLLLGAMPEEGAWDSLSFDIGVVDRATGSLLYFCSSNAEGDYVDRPDAMLSGPITQCLHRYFPASRAVKYTHGSSAMKLGDACLAYRAKYLHYPKDLKVLVPEFISSVPAFRLWSPTNCKTGWRIVKR